VSKLRSDVEQLKQVLKREYASFFDPMERQYYSGKVTFDDPLTNLEGVDSYQTNVDMLSGRTLLGKLLFRDAGIVLHSVEGGNVVVVDEGGSNKIRIEDVVTRWTLRMTVQILPWQPTARFSGISVYRLEAGGPRGVQVAKQTDYWDSINLKPVTGGNSDSNGNDKSEFERYGPVDKGLAIADFLNQLKPDAGLAPSAGGELPYSLLRRGKDYQIRRYPAYVAAQTVYDNRRDEAFAALGSFCSDVVGTSSEPLSPSIIEVTETGATAKKRMTWPLAYASPTDPEGVVEARANEFRRKAAATTGGCRIVTVPERVVAVATFTDASAEPVVRKADSQLRLALVRDGLLPSSSSQNQDDEKSSLEFAQYDAVYSMGKRRGEVWIELEDGAHPWSSSSS